MATRVALIGTGNCGSLALKQLVNDARFDLTGVCVSSDVKVGRDAGELAGLNVTTGVAATDDLDVIIAAKPDCIVYCAMATPGRQRRWLTFGASSARVSTSWVRRPECCSTRGR